MFCKTPWERDFMNEVLTKKFVNTSLKNHVENVFLDQQISLLPETQQAARNEKKVREISEELQTANVVLNQLKKAILDQQDIIKSYNLQIHILKTGQYEPERLKTNFTHKCKKDDCKGGDCPKNEDCEGDDCPDPDDCEGDDCPSPKKDDDCEGDDCPKPCKGDDCPDPDHCEGDDCPNPP
jgi:hypothetical protein